MSNPSLGKCFACGRKLEPEFSTGVDTRDGQWVWVGRECFRKIQRAGEAGYQPPKGGPKLYPMTPEAWATYIAQGLT